MRQPIMNDRFIAALKKLYEETPIEDIIAHYEARDFIEIVGRAGGDTLTYRVYDDGRVYER